MSDNKPVILNKKNKYCQFWFHADCWL